MYYQQKKTIVSILQAVVLLAVYIIYVVGKVNAGAAAPDDVKFFAVTMLIFIGIGIGVGIVVQVLFHVLFSVSVAVQERDKDGETIKTAVNAAMVEDERDKMIDLKSMQITFTITMIGFVAGLGMIALGHSVVLMLNMLYLALCGLVPLPKEFQN